IVTASPGPITRIGAGKVLAATTSTGSPTSHIQPDALQASGSGSDAGGAIWHAASSRTAARLAIRMVISIASAPILNHDLAKQPRGRDKSWAPVPPLRRKPENRWKSWM